MIIEVVFARSSDFTWSNSASDDTCKIKRFVFSASAIKALKAKAISDLQPHPSRVEVISAFIWKHALAALNKLNKEPRNGKGKTSYFTHTINLRNPNLTPLSLRCMGSLTLASVASIGWDEKEQDLSGYVAKVHEAILKVNKEHVNKFRGEEALEAMWADAEMLLLGREGIYMCASMCKIGFNDLDFGWGKPIWGSPWAGAPTLAERNFLILVDFNGGEGIEAWLVLEKQEMTILETDKEFLKFATPITGIHI